MFQLSDTLADLVACPACLAPLHNRRLGVEPGLTCDECGTRYPHNADGQLDLRLRASRQYTFNFQIDGLGAPEPSESMPTLRLEPIPPNPSPAFDFRSVPIPPLLTHGNRLTRELLSYFPVSRTGGAMLDLGCGDEDFREISSLTNLEYIGVDYSGGKPRILADAHSLPFKDQAFDFIISFAVLEHLRYPFVAMREALRVLKPGGTFIGTVAFLEPFHMDSFYHPSHLGTHNLLSSAGFEVRHLEPNSQWMNLYAQAHMSLFPHSPRLFARAMVLPLELMHRAWWKLGRLVQNTPTTTERARQLSNTGGFRFVCTRPASSVEHQPGQVRAAAASA
jgi:ubiquinone/menaquinone biosynthesis C-methylase UbiE